MQFFFKFLTQKINRHVLQVHLQVHLYAFSINICKNVNGFEEVVTLAIAKTL